MIPVFDRALLDRHRRRALAAARPGTDFLLTQAVDDLLDRLAAVRRDFALALDLGTPTPLLAARLIAGGRAAGVVRLDRLGLGTAETLVVKGDEEALPFGRASFDLAVSALGLHFVNDLPGTLAQLRAALKPDGLFLATLLGGDTLSELRTAFALAEAEIRGGAAPRVAPFAQLRDVGGLLQRAGFALPVIDQDRLTVRYDSALGLMRDLKAMGAANALIERSRQPLRRDVLLRAAALYDERFGDPDGRVRATFQIISISGWAPDASQPRPLRPGGARAGLADALDPDRGGGEPG